MKRAICQAVLTAIVLAVLVGGAVAQPATGEGLVIQGADASAFPEVSVTVSLPLELYGDGSAAPVFSVTENGVDRPVSSAEPLQMERPPMDVVLLVDTSGSMRGDPMANAREAAARFIDVMAPQDSAAVVAFDSEVRVVSEFTSDKARLRAAVAGLEARGNTALYDGVIRSSTLLQQRDGQDAAIVLLSDGGDTASVSSLDQAVAAVEQSGVPLLTIALRTPELDMEALTTLAARSRGRLVEVEVSSDLVALYDSIARELATQFRLTFESAMPNTRDLEIGIAASAGERSASATIVMDNPYFEMAAGEGEGTAPASPVVSWSLAIGVILLSFTSVSLASLGLLSMFTRHTERIDQLRFYDQLTGSKDHVTTHAAGVSGAVFDALGEVAGRRGFTSLMRTKLERAGMPLRPVEYMYTHILFVVGAGLVTQLLTRSVMLSVLVVAIAIVLPMLLLENAIQRRRAAFEEQLPEILSLMAGSLRAGWGIQQSIDLVVDEIGEPAAAEFKRAQAEARLGLSVEEALGKMAERLDSEDFRWTVTAIAIQREVGGNLAEVLDVLADTMRQRAELKRHVHALTSEGRLSAAILYALPFVMLLLLMVVNPGYMNQMIGSLAGLMMLGFGALLMIVGGFWLDRAIKVEV